LPSRRRPRPSPSAQRLGRGHPGGSAARLTRERRNRVAAGRWESSPLLWTEHRGFRGGRSGVAGGSGMLGAVQARVPAFGPLSGAGLGGCEGWGAAGTPSCGRARCPLLFCPERCERQLYTTEFYEKLLLKKVTDGRRGEAPSRRGSGCREGAGCRGELGHASSPGRENGAEIPRLPRRCCCRDAGGQEPTRGRCRETSGVSEGGEQPGQGPCPAAGHPKAASLRRWGTGAPIREASGEVRKVAEGLRAGAASPAGVGARRGVRGARGGG